MHSGAQRPWQLTPSVEKCFEHPYDTPPYTSSFSALRSLQHEGNEWAIPKVIATRRHNQQKSKNQGRLWSEFKPRRQLQQGPHEACFAHFAVVIEYKGQKQTTELRLPKTSSLS